MAVDHVDASCDRTSASRSISSINWRGFDVGIMKVWRKLLGLAEQPGVDESKHLFRCGHIQRRPIPIIAQLRLRERPEREPFSQTNWWVVCGATRNEDHERMNWYDPVKRVDFSGLLLTTHFLMGNLNILNIAAIADFYSDCLYSFFRSVS